MLTRAEHLALARGRALDCLARGELAHAAVGFASDMRAHPETAPLAPWSLVGLPLDAIGAEDVEGVQRWIEGFR
jgi:hypothetical protein